MSSAANNVDSNRPQVKASDMDEELLVNYLSLEKSV